MHGPRVYQTHFHTAAHAPMHTDITDVLNPDKKKRREKKGCEGFLENSLKLRVVVQAQTQRDEPSIRVPTALTHGPYQNSNGADAAACMRHFTLDTDAGEITIEPLSLQAARRCSSHGHDHG